MLHVRALNQFYGQSRTLWDVDMDVESGACVSLIGRNGVGKTTLLKCLMGLLPIDSGEMDGEVLRGERQGMRLGELELAGVVVLLTEFEDPRSRQLLTAYLDRRAPGWNDAGQDNQNVHHDSMTVERALRVLDLPDTANRDDVIAAHRRLMQRLHPDRGGSAFLAATLNEAKKVLLDNL